MLRHTITPNMESRHRRMNLRLLVHDPATEGIQRGEVTARH